MRIDVYLDDSEEPIQRLTPPEKFNFDTKQIEDGEHKLTFRAFNENGDSSVRVIPFQVHNGPAIAIHGIARDDRLSGDVPILANAYSSTVGDEFEPVLMETPAPIPTWAWVIFLSVLAWGGGYISLEVNQRINGQTSVVASGGATPSVASSETSAKENDWSALGQQVYGNNCSSCHQANGSGLPGVFPPLKGNTVVLASDAAGHIRAVLEGVSGKIIDGITYASPMPGFSAQLSDEEVASVVNHERTQWGNNATTIAAEDVAKLR
jgi:cytochrome c oxidase subunit II